MTGQRDNLNNSLYLQYSYLLLMLEVYENLENWRSFHHLIFKRFVLNKIKLIEEELKKEKDLFSPLCSCNDYMEIGLMIANDYLRFRGEDEFENLDIFLTCKMVTTVDSVYCTRFLILTRKLEQATSLLEASVEQEGDFSTSMVIWPKELFESRLIDDKLRNALIQSSEDYMVFPTNLYARYLLNITYSTLGQVENRRNNMTELTVLRERYSQFHEFAPMLKIMSTIVIC